MSSPKRFYELHEKIKNAFQGDEAKAHLWMTTPNPLLGNVRPDDLALYNFEKIDKFVDDLLEDN